MALKYLSRNANTSDILSLKSVNCLFPYDFLVLFVPSKSGMNIKYLEYYHTRLSFD